jgi:isochorismate synthase
MIAVERSDLSRCRAVVSEVHRVDPLALMQDFEGWPLAAIESRSGGFTLGIGEAFVLEARGPDRFSQIEKQARRVFASFRQRGLRLLGGFAFEETDARFVLPRWLYQVSGEAAHLTLVLRGDEDPAKVELERERLMRALEAPPAIEPVPRALRVERLGDYAESVRRAVHAIHTGELEKVVLARRIRVEAEASYRMPAVLSALKRTAGAVRFGFTRSNEFFAGSTPELLVAKSGMEARSEALAGSARPELAGALLDSPKERSEHGYVARFVRTTLDAFSPEVEVANSELSLLSHVAHLRTPLRARLARPIHLLELAAALHPTPAVGGVPRAAAAEFIRAIEVEPRGWYAGPVGWFDAEGDGELFVALRSARFTGATAELWAGAGIVADSDPEAEARETELKAMTVASALGAAT